LYGYFSVMGHFLLKLIQGIGFIYLFHNYP